MKLIRGGTVLTPDEVIEGASVWIDGGRILGVEEGERGRSGTPDPTVIDATGLTVIPGLIDIHTHGADGVQANDGTIDAYARLARFYARHGVTGFLAGVYGDRAEIEGGIDAALAWLRRVGSGLGSSRERGDRRVLGEDRVLGERRVLDEDRGLGERRVLGEGQQFGNGAALLGIYLEGPFLDPAWAGAFVPDTILEPDAETLRGYIERADGALRLLTLAPERPGAEVLVELARANGIVCAIGHSGATFEEVLRAAERGVTHVTHTYNAMPGMHHRAPSGLGAALTDDRFTVEIIADGVHVHPAMVRLLTRAKRLEDVVLITDSVGAAGLPDGSYRFHEGDLRVLDGTSVRLADGTLAGSTLTMEKGVANLVAFGAASLPEAVAMGSTNPARVLGLDSRKGRVAVGFDADLVALTPELEVAWTIVRGELVYRQAAGHGREA